MKLCQDSEERFNDITGEYSKAGLRPTVPFTSGPVQGLQKKRALLNDNSAVLTGFLAYQVSTHLTNSPSETEGAPDFGLQGISGPVLR